MPFREAALRTINLLIELLVPEAKASANKKNNLVLSNFRVKWVTESDSWKSLAKWSMSSLKFRNQVCNFPTSLAGGVLTDDVYPSFGTTSLV